jgi:hypothetical protein
MPTFVSQVTRTRALDRLRLGKLGVSRAEETYTRAMYDN